MQKYNNTYNIMTMHQYVSTLELSQCYELVFEGQYHVMLQ